MQRQKTYLTILVVALFTLIIPVARFSAQSFGASKLGIGRKYSTIERMNLERLRAVNADKLKIQQGRHAVKLQTGFGEYKAILHAHAEDSAHTGGTRPELLAAAKRGGVKIIMLTDHVRPPKDFIADSWRGMRDGVLFIPGAESEGFLVYPQRSIIQAHINKSIKSREEYVQLVKEPVGQNRGDIFLSHVEEKGDWDTSQLDGLEIYNIHSDLLDEAEFVRWLQGAFVNPGRLKQLEAALNEFPAETFGALQDYLPTIIAKWDRDLPAHRLTGVAANDCHHNQRFTVTAVAEDAIEVTAFPDPPRKFTTRQAPGIAEMLKGRKTGEVIAKLDFDPYERSLTFVATHILLKELNEPAVRQALRQGHAFVAHDWLCDATGFAFVAERGGKRIGVMGDEVKLEPGLNLRLAAPAKGTIKLFHNGQPVQETASDRLDFIVKEAGIYRAEVWLTLDGEQRPWIYANPIYVR
ncbi:MAG: histidinol phosphatase [Acidobacteria bacterium]|nr:histidinol phosphatase [Acidobacteriota bacterium]